VFFGEDQPGEAFGEVLGDTPAVHIAGAKIVKGGTDFAARGLLKIGEDFCVVVLHVGIFRIHLAQLVRGVDVAGGGRLFKEFQCAGRVGRNEVAVEIDFAQRPERLRKLLVGFLPQRGETGPALNGLSRRDQAHRWALVRREAQAIFRIFVDVG
jgi:hypothetical protein